MHNSRFLQLGFLFVCITGLLPQVSGQYFKAIRSNEGVEIREMDKKVLFYQQGPRSIAGKYERAGYVHPVYSLNEKILTEDFPEDHPYHHGIFWAWHQIILNNEQIADGWISENISWKPHTLKVKKRRRNVLIKSEMIWLIKLPNADSAGIIKEFTRVRVHQANSQYRAIDFEIRLFPLMDGLKIGGSDDAKGYGGFCLRLNLPKDISFFSKNKAVTASETAVVAGPWLNFVGSFDGPLMPPSGIAVFCYQGPDQQPWILRKEKSMQNIPYPGRTPVILPKEGLTMKYRMIIHNGDLSNENLEELYRQYIQHP